MNKNYETPSIEIIKFDLEILTSGASIVVNYPWAKDNESDYFE